MALIATLSKNFFGINYLNSSIFKISSKIVQILAHEKLVIWGGVFNSLHYICIHYKETIVHAKIRKTFWIIFYLQLLTDDNVPFPFYEANYGYFKVSYQTQNPQAFPWAFVCLSVYIRPFQRGTISPCRPKPCKTAGPDLMQNSRWAAIHYIKSQKRKLWKLQFMQDFGTRDL